MIQLDRLGVLRLWNANRRSQYWYESTIDRRTAMPQTGPMRNLSITKLDGQTRVRQHTYERWNKKHTKVLESQTYDINEQACTIAAFGETRTVWCTYYPTDATPRYRSEFTFASRTRFGSKLHRESLTFEFDEAGRAHIYNTVALNRQATIIGWWKPEYDAANGLGSKHIGG